MTPTDLIAFQRRLGWRRNRLGEELGISQDRLRRMLDGHSPIPRHIALACAALALGVPPMGNSEVALQDLEKWPGIPPAGWKPRPLEPSEIDSLRQDAISTSSEMKTLISGKPSLGRRSI
jgi:hypothetical protein